MRTEIVWWEANATVDFDPGSVPTSLQHLLQNRFFFASSSASELALASSAARSSSGWNARAKRKG